MRRTTEEIMLRKLGETLPAHPAGTGSWVVSTCDRFALLISNPKPSKCSRSPFAPRLIPVRFFPPVTYGSLGNMSDSSFLSDSVHGLGSNIGAGGSGLADDVAGHYDHHPGGNPWPTWQSPSPTNTLSHPSSNWSTRFFHISHLPPSPTLRSFVLFLVGAAYLNDTSPVSSYSVSPIPIDIVNAATPADQIDPNLYSMEFHERDSDNDPHPHEQRVLRRGSSSSFRGTCHMPAPALGSLHTFAHPRGRRPTALFLKRT